MVTARLPADPEPRASILIAAFNPPAFGRCVRSLATHLDGDPPGEVIATLNGPTDALLEAAGDVDGLRTVDTPVNLGLAAGLNAARAVARGEYLVLLQDDAEIEPGWLEALVTAADANPDAGAVGGLVCWPDGERVQTAGLVLWADCSHTEVGGGTTRSEWNEREPFAVDYCSSSSLLVRAETWDAIGGADAAFFPAGHVDADLGMRIRAAGRAVLVAPGARTRHRRGASSTKRFKRFIAVRNAMLFRQRWGEELARAQEPRGDAGPEEVDRALARAAERRGALVPSGAPGSASAAPDPVVMAQRHVELHEAYEAELESALDHFEAEAIALRARVAELTAAFDDSERKLAAITGGRWWRLRGRLLPLTRLAGRVRRGRAA
jgi:GT2 family glycosyltransferase